MKHGISEQEWDDYLEGRTDEKMRDRLEAHLIGCLSCWETHETLAHAERTLRQAARELSFDLNVSDRDLNLAKQRVFANLDRSENGVQARLDALAAVLAPMCGEQIAKNALLSAAVDSPARSLERVSAANWTPFLTRLTKIAAVMCGDAGASLVWESGQWEA